MPCKLYCVSADFADRRSAIVPVLSKSLRHNIVAHHQKHHKEEHKQPRKMEKMSRFFE